MAEHKEEEAEPVTEKITEHFDSSSSSSDSDDEKSKSKSAAASAAEAIEAKIYRLFGREKPVHTVLGGGKRTSPNFLFIFLFFFFLMIEMVV